MQGGSARLWARPQFLKFTGRRLKPAINSIDSQSFADQRKSLQGLKFITFGAEGLNNLN
jgi:hypothetical protein